MKAFVIRLWTPAGEVEGHAPQAPELRGTLEPVGSQEPVPFKDGAELIGLLRNELRARVGSGE